MKKTTYRTSKIFIKRKLITIAVILGFLSFSCFRPAPIAEAATDAVLQFDSPTYSADVGDPVNIIARVNPGSNEVGAVELDVTFNPSKLRLDSITRSSAFNTTLAAAAIDNTGTGDTDGNGSIDVGKLADTPPYVITTSDVATFAFTALAAVTDSPVAFAATSNASAHGLYVVQSRLSSTVTLAAADTTPPSFTVNNDVSDIYVKTDTINITVSDTSGVASQFYGYSSDVTCNGSDTIGTAFSSATNFDIAGNRSDYLCVKATDSSSNNNVGYELVGQLHTDNTGPGFSVGNGTSATATKTDTINITVSDSASGVASRYYGHSNDDTCNGSDTISTAFTSATNFDIAGDFSDYLCVKATDSAGNESYQTVGQLHTDNTPPTATEGTPVTEISSDNTPSYTFSSTEAGTITYGGGCTSSTTSASSGSNAITFGALTRGADYNCTVRVTDTALNQSAALNVTEFAITYQGDLDNNRTVNANDFTTLADDYGRTSWCGHASDIDGSCIVNTNDFTILADDYGKTF